MTFPIGIPLECLPSLLGRRRMLRSSELAAPLPLPPSPMSACFPLHAAECYQYCAASSWACAAGPSCGECSDTKWELSSSCLATCYLPGPPLPPSFHAPPPPFSLEIQSAPPPALPVSPDSSPLPAYPYLQNCIVAEGEVYTLESSHIECEQLRIDGKLLVGSHTSIHAETITVGHSGSLFVGSEKSPAMNVTSENLLFPSPPLPLP